MNPVWLGLTGGVLAFAHCLGMCGGFALHLSGGASRWGALGRQLLWHLGKTSTYVFLGALAGFAGDRIGSWGNVPFWQNALAWTIGGGMVLMGLMLLGLFPRRARQTSGGEEPGLFTSLFRHFFREPTAGGAFTLGLANGFLPCPLVLGFLALCVRYASVPVGMGIMAAMGLGTVWSLLALGMTGHMLTARARRWSPILGGVILVVLGGVTALRGTEAFHRVFGCPAAGGEETSSMPDCCHPDHASTPVER